MRVTKGDRDRAYHVAMSAIAEMARSGAYTGDELCRLMREAWQSCYGDLKKPPKTKQEKT